MAESEKNQQQPQQPVKFEAEPLAFWQQHRLSVLLAGTVLIAIVLTVISVIMYNTSGAAQLDLSRPGYRAVSDKVEKQPKIDSYSSTGPVTKDSIQEFIKLYDKQLEKAKAVDAFNGDPLNPEVLEFGTSEAAE